MNEGERRLEIEGRPLLDTIKLWDTDHLGRGTRVDFGELRGKWDTDSKQVRIQQMKISGTVQKKGLLSLVEKVGISDHVGVGERINALPGDELTIDFSFDFGEKPDDWLICSSKRLWFYDTSGERTVDRGPGDGVQESMRTKLLQDGKYALTYNLNDLLTGDVIYKINKPLTIVEAKDCGRSPDGAYSIRIIATRKDVAAATQKSKSSDTEVAIREFESAKSQVVNLTAENLRLVRALEEEKRARAAERQEVFFELQKALRNKPGILGGESGLRKAIEAIVQKFKDI